MIIRNLFVYVLTLAITLSSCQSKNDKTFIFNKYLNSNFSRSIPKNEKTFVIFPIYGCGGCMSRVVNEFLKNDYLQHKDYCLIVSNLNYLPLLEMHYDSILIDSIGMIENYDLQIGNITVITTRNEQIKKIFNINKAQDLRKLLE